MKVGDIVGLKADWYMSTINQKSGTIECKTEKGSFLLPLDCALVKDCIGEYNDSFYKKTFVMPEFNKKTLLTDPYDMYYHFILGEKPWINVALYNTPIHGQYLIVRAEIHPFNKSVNHAEKNAIISLNEGDRIFGIIMRKLAEVDESNEIIFSNENEAILCRSVRKKRIDHIFNQYIRLETAGKSFNEGLIDKVLSRINQMTFPSLVTGKVTHIFSTTEGETVVFTDEWNTFAIKKELLTVKDVF